ncbi:hypothetical protein DFQ01_14446 [Paenibacillus cellulosilyticus]|uniref:Uncharacterized protein n=1 Tax=Paenibacillus cellulosilyticus TaxID=375489 RepID=A0A2V2YEA6_9BACL|nr:hypothetical protein [Paenibacillus cellulosilyticus]PWV90270.1 hypothetical protein DFQ01_14446 [Paenibacillus cellulosilyticus]QKS43428.1 hypothetical protein HUB94_02585 [Paenibacillus cellulosilyticus]
MASAQDTTGMIGIRSDLNAKGIDNSRIGYSNGYVTIDGQNFIKPTTVSGGVSYADPTAYNNTYNTYNTYTSNQATKTAQDNYLSALNNTTTNPYDQQVSDTLASYYDKLTNQTPYDVYNSDEYAAYQAQADRAAQKSTRAAQESMGASGFGRSTNLADRAQSIQNDENEYMQLQVVPQLQAAYDSKQQQQLAALGTYLDALTGQQGLYDTRTQEGINNLYNAVNYLSGRSDQAYQTQYQAERDKVTDTQQQELLEIQQAALTGMYKGKQTTAAQQQAFENAWTESVQMGKVSDSLANLTGIPAGTLLESTRQFNANLAEQQASRAQTASIAAADRAQRASDNAADRALQERLAANKESDQNAASTGLTAAERQQEGSALLSALRAGELTPAQAWQQIQDDLSLGLYSAEDAKYLQGIVQQIAPSTQAPAATQDQIAASGAKSDKEVEAEAKAKGYPTLDYLSWYKSANGRLGGVDFQTWQSLYGPRLTQG